MSGGTLNNPSRCLRKQEWSFTYPKDTLLAQNRNMHACTYAHACTCVHVCTHVHTHTRTDKDENCSLHTNMEACSDPPSGPHQGWGESIKANFGCGWHHIIREIQVPSYRSGQPRVSSLCSYIQITGGVRITAGRDLKEKTLCLQIHALKFHMQAACFFHDHIKYLCLLLHLLETFVVAPQGAGR